MNADKDYDILDVFCRDFLRRIHTVKPAVVTAVNSDNTVDAKILTKTRYKDGTITEFPDVLNVPFFILAANKGGAKITIPIAVGDNVTILFSDRDYSTLLDSDGTQPVEPVDIYTHQYHPILALPCFFTSPNAITVDPSTIVIQNGSNTIRVTETGMIEIASNQIRLAGNVEVEGLLTVNGVVMNTHFHLPSTTPPSN